MEPPSTLQQKEEEEKRLLERAKAGDAAAAEVLFQRYRPQVERFARRGARSQEDARDIAQNVFLEAWQSLPRFRAEARLSTWLYQVTRNVTSLFYRKEKAPLASLDSQEDEFSATLQHGPINMLQKQIESHELTAILLTAVAEVCKPEEQWVIRLYYQDRPLNEIARLLNMKDATVRSHLRRGRCSLLKHLIEQRSELFGGKEAIQSAWRNVCAAADPADRPDQKEIASWEARRGEHFCGAIFKLAKTLSLLVLLLWASPGGKQ